MIDEVVFLTYESIGPVFSRTMVPEPSRPQAILLVKIICNRGPQETVKPNK
jgi:hypothetical protein